MLALLACAWTPPAHAAVQGFTLQDALIDCQADCARIGRIPIPVAPGKLLCALAKKDGTITAYGTWRQGLCEYADSAQAGKSVRRANRYRCACRAAATVLSWNASLACIEGGSAAAADPAACRFRKLGGGDWQAGYIQVPPNQTPTCRAHGVPFGEGGAMVGSVAGIGGPFVMRTLCLITPSNAGRRRLASFTTFDLSPGLPNCAFTCSVFGPGITHVDAGVPGRYLCSTKNKGATYYGTTGDAGECFWNGNQGGFVSGTLDGYKCGCRESDTTLQWKQSNVCARGPAAAATSPAVCRVRKLGGGDFKIGWYRPLTRRCYIPVANFGPGGKQVTSVKFLGGPYQMSLLCRPAPDYRRCPGVARTRAGLAQRARDLAAAQPPIVYSNHPSSRWTPIAHARCPPAAPAAASDVALIAWFYWQAFGAGPDYLCGNAWGDSNLARLAGRGVRRWRAPDPGAGGGVVAPQLTAVQAALPGDVFFYGRPHSMAAMYLGAGEVLAFSPLLPGPPKVLPAGFRPDLNEVRTYPDFLL